MKELSTDAWSTIVIVFLLFIVGMGAVGNDAYEDALEEERFYTEMVCKGFWPDYKSLGVECEDINGADGRG